MSDLSQTSSNAPIVASLPVVVPLEKTNAVLIPESKTLTGRVVWTQSGFFHVETELGLITSQISGKLKIAAQRAESKDEIKRSDLVALNDHVVIEVEPSDAGPTGSIVEVHERVHVLSRVEPGDKVGTSAEIQQIIIANCDQAVFVFSARKPEPNTRALDRLLVCAEKAEIPSIVICVNKIDLVKKETIETLFEPYQKIGYRVLLVSALTGAGVENLREVLSSSPTQVSVFTGPSGVGKSSLLNTIQSGLRLKTNEVSEATTKGRHTTRFSQLLRLDGGGYVADTPGIRAIAPWDVEPEELDGYFIEMRPFIEKCKFADCSHRHEPGCEVRRAVEQRCVTQARYDSYLRLREELEEQYIY